MEGVYKSLYIRSLVKSPEIYRGTVNLLIIIYCEFLLAFYSDLNVSARARLTVFF